MVRELAETLHVTPSVLYTVALAGLLIAALVVGFVLNRILHHWTKKLRNAWRRSCWTWPRKQSETAWKGCWPSRRLSCA